MWSALYFGLTADFPALTLRQAITKHWTGYGWAGQFFLVVLLQLVVLFPLVRRVQVRPRFLLAAWSSFALLFAVLQAVGPRASVLAKVGDRLGIYWIPLVWFGIWLARRQPPQWGPPWWVVLAGLAGAAMEARWCWAGQAQFSPYLLPTVFVAAALVVLWGTGLGKRPGWPGQLERVARYVGVRSMGVFVLNPLVLWLLGPLCEATLLRVSAQGVVAVLGPWGITGVVVLCSLAGTELLSHAGLRAFVR